MTRKEIITLMVEDQIKRGVIKSTNKALQIKARLKGMYGIKAMTLNECVSYYNNYLRK